MADRKWTDFPVATSLDAADYLSFVDVSDPDTSTKNKIITASNLKDFIEESPFTMSGASPVFNINASTDNLRITSANSVSNENGATIRLYNGSHGAFGGAAYFDYGDFDNPIPATAAFQIRRLSNGVRYGVVEFENAGTTRFYGNVGIGRSPTSPLDVIVADGSAAKIETASGSVGESAYLNFQGARGSIGYAGAGITGGSELKIASAEKNVVLNTNPTTADNFIVLYASSDAVSIGTNGLARININSSGLVNLPFDLQVDGDCVADHITLDGTVKYINTDVLDSELILSSNSHSLRDDGAVLRLYGGANATTGNANLYSGSYRRAIVGTPTFGIYLLNDGAQSTVATFLHNGSNAQTTITDLLRVNGDIGLTGSRVTKGWFTDLEVTNAPTVGGVSIGLPLKEQITITGGVPAALSQTPVSEDAFLLFLNGQLANEGAGNDYTRSGTTITWIGVTLLDTDVMIASYRY